MKSYGIIVSGGPAPGINSVISSAVIEGSNRGLRIVGFQDGFDGVLTDPQSAIRPLTINDVSRIHTTGGSILGTSRRNPFHTAESSEQFRAALRAHDLAGLIVIGGDGSAYLSSQIHVRLPELHVVHVPKTIDNDLDLPGNAPSFGFESARHRGMEIASTITVDAKTCHRWFLLTAMGRQTGFLALGLGLASGITRTLIPEEFTNHSLSPAELAAELFKTMRVRATHGKPYGVLMVAEGVLDALDPARSPEIQSCPRDDIGRINYAQVELGEIIQPHLERHCSEAGFRSKIITKNLGYELRCCEPVAFDIEYTRLLGYGAIEGLVHQTSGMVVRDRDHIRIVPFSEFVTAKGSIRTRRVDLHSDTYLIAQRYMVK